MTRDIDRMTPPKPDPVGWVLVAVWAFMVWTLILRSL